MAARTSVRRVLAGPVRRVRPLVQRVFAPEVARLVADRDKARAELDGLGADRDRLFRELAVAFESVTAAHQGIADLQAEQRALRERLDHTLLFAEAMAPRLEPLEDGLLEARRQSLRIAELADVVTEIVLPLHDRDIDPSAVEKLRTDTF